MTAAQQRSRDINRRFEATDRRFIVLVSASALLTTISLILIFFQILQVNTRLEAQIKENRQATEQAVKDIKAENERIHKQYADFLLKCIILLQRDQLIEAAASNCTESSDSLVLSNNTPLASSQAVINPTNTEEAAIQPPKAPEQPQPSSPVPTAPPPENFVSSILKLFGL